MFVALRGEHFDGHDFIEGLIKRGLRFFLVDRNFDSSGFEDSRLYFHKVENTLFELGKIAGRYRNLFNIPSVVITGSCGKTTTKELCAAFLQSKYKVLKSEGNFNNEIGVPKTLLRLNNEHEIILLEAGMNHPGELKRISGFTCHECAAITNVHSVHIENFENEEEIAEAKSEILFNMQGRKRAVLNRDNAHFEYLQSRAEERGAKEILTFSLNEAEKTDKGFVYKGASFETKAYGNFFISNILCAVKIAEGYGVSAKQCAAALKSYKNAENRLEEYSINKMHIVNDSYNSNPAALKEMLKYLDGKVAKYKIAVLGTMLELGKDSGKLHKELGCFINGTSISHVFTFGKGAENYHCRKDNRVVWKHFNEADSLLAELEAFLKDENSSAALFKGSHGSKIWKVEKSFKQMCRLD